MHGAPPPERDTLEADGSSRAGAWLLVRAFAPDAGAEARVHRLDEPVLGIDRAPRHDELTIRVDDPAISKGAVSLVRVAHAFELVDRGSANAVRRNGVPTTRSLLVANDVIRVGDTLFVVERDDIVRGASRQRATAPDERAPLLRALHAGVATASLQLATDLALCDRHALTTVVSSHELRAFVAAATWLGEGHAPVVAGPLDDAAAICASAGARPVAIGHVPAGRAEAAALWQAVEVRRAAGARTFLRQPSVAAQERGSLIDLALAAGAEHLVLPSLQQRRADILPALVAAMNRPGAARAMTAGFAEQALAWDWPRGLDELDRVAGRAGRLFDTSGIIDERALPSDARQTPGSGPHAAASANGSEITQSAVRAAMTAYQGNVTDVARHFGLSRSYFYRKVRRLGIELHDDT